MSVHTRDGTQGTNTLWGCDSNNHHTRVKLTFLFMQRNQAKRSKDFFAERKRAQMLIDRNDATSLSLPLSQDIQPSSMLIDHAGNVKLCDFGLYGWLGWHHATGCKCITAKKSWIIFSAKTERSVQPLCGGYWSHGLTRCLFPEFHPWCAQTCSNNALSATALHGILMISFPTVEFADI